MSEELRDHSEWVHIEDVEAAFAEFMSGHGVTEEDMPHVWHNMAVRMIPKMVSRPPVDSVGVDVEKVRSVLSQVEHWERHTPDVPGAQHYHKGRLNSWIKQLRAALTAPADGCEGCLFKDREEEAGMPCRSCARYYPNHYAPTPTEGR